MAAPPINENGVEITQGGDAICEERAAAAGLSGTFLAWLSDSNTSPASRFTKSTEPYVLIDGTIVANDWMDLTDGEILHPIDLDEFGEPAEGAWTGTTADGNPTGVDCNNWSWPDTANGDYGTIGIGNSDFGWTDATDKICGGTVVERFSLYCFEQ